LQPESRPDEIPYPKAETSFEHQIAPIAFTDSGYASRTYKQNTCTHGNESTVSPPFILDADSGGQIPGLKGDVGSDDARTIYSETSSINTISRDNYVSRFAGDLFHEICPDLPKPDVLKILREVLPTYLEAFALRIGLEADVQVNRDVMRFIYRNRELVHVSQIASERIMLEGNC
jgi:hypothetical protein